MIVAGVNYFVDPANIYKARSFEKEILTTLASGSNAAFAITLSQVDEVQILKKTVESFKEAPELLVIGSSRAFPINKNLFPGHSFYNASLSSCKTGDVIAIYDLFQSKNLIPQTVILGVDPDFFVLSPFPKDDLWNEFYSMNNVINTNFSTLEKFAHLQKLINNKIQKKLELFSPAYFQDSFKFFLIKNFHLNFGNFNSEKISANNLNKMSYWSTTDEHAMGGVMFPDGSREFGDNVIYLEGVNKLQYTTKLLFDMERIKSKSFVMRDDSKRIFESFVKYLKSQNVNVVFTLMPEHTMFYGYEKSFNPANPVPIMVENYVLNFANENQIPIIGSYDLSKTNLTNDDMVDHHHPHRGSMNKFFH